MQNKILLVLFLFITSLTQSQIVTNKKEAIKKGTYEKQATQATAQSKQVAAKSKTTKSKRNKAISVDEDNGNDLIIGPTENYLSVQMINNAMEFLGVHYRGGGTSRAGMDCSGMVTAVF